LIELLGLTDEEALAIFQLDPLSAISGRVAHRPELDILLTLLREAADQIGSKALRSWLRAGSPSPLELLRTQRFAAFEDAVEELLSRGFVLRGGG
jgi:hypothetical protein